MTKQAKIYRQGDVWIYEIGREQFRRTRLDARPMVFPDPEKGVILAEGEVTGHHHRLPQADRVKLYPSHKQQVRLLEVRPDGFEARKPVDLVHEEHETIKLPPGHYEVRIQREYDPSLHKRQTYVRD